MELFGVGPLEALLVGVIAFLVVGPDRFPELARQAGKWYRVARAFTADVMSDVQGAVKEIEDEIESTSGGSLRSIRELADVGNILSEARADAEVATTEAQAAVESGANASSPVAAEESPVSALTEPEPEGSTPAEDAVVPPPAPAATSTNGGAYGDPFDAAEVKRREAAAREAAARITGGGA